MTITEIAELSVKQVEAERLRRDKRNIRNETIEECARVAEDWHRSTSHAWDIAAAIRALKDKP